MIYVIQSIDNEFKFVIVTKIVDLTSISKM